MKDFFILIILLGLISLSSCDEEGKRMSDFEDYSGPIKVVHGSEILHSDSGTVKARIISKKILGFENGNQDMPLGVYLEFFNRSFACLTQNTRTC